MTQVELDKIAHDLIDIRGMIKELEAEAESLTDKIKGEMIERGEEVIVGDNWKASWVNVNSSKFDSKAFKADHAELYQEYVKANTFTRFNFTV